MGSTRVSGANMAHHFIDRHLTDGRGDHPAILHEGRSMSYASVGSLVDRVAGGLGCLGVTRGQRVMIVLPDSPEFVAAYFGAAKLGAVAVPTSTGLRSHEYASRLDASCARVLVTHESLWPAVGPALAGRPFLRQVLVCGGSACGRIGWDAWVERQVPQRSATPTSPGDIAFWLWTSGSTGEAKAVPHRHQDWIDSSEQFATGVLDLCPDDRTFSSSKLFHAYGLGNGLMFPFHRGATTVLFPGRPTARAVLEVAEQARPTLFFSVPTLYAAMLQEAEVGREGSGERSYDLSSVRLGVSAAEPLPAEIFRRWRQRFGFEVLDGIGSTEVVHIYISARSGSIRPGSTGTPVPGYEIRLLDTQGQPVAAGEVGELWVRGASVASFYWRQPALTGRRWRDGWFHTGDMYVRDQEEHYWYSGRADDMLKVSGQWLSPIEVENVMVEHPAVLEAAVVGYQTRDGLTKPMAFVALKTGRLPSDQLAAELQDFVRQRLEPFKYPRQVHFLESLPKTATGKIERYRLRSGWPLPSSG